MDSVTNQKEKIYYVSAKNRNKAIILAIVGFLGFAGLHRLYVGRSLSGFIYFLTFGFLGIGTIVDLYFLLSDSFDDGDGYPLYSYDSMKKNYRRRQPKAATPTYVYIAMIFAFFCLPALFFRLISKDTPMDEERRVETTKQALALTERIKEYD